MTAPVLTRALRHSHTSFNVSWIINNLKYNYTVTWSNLHTGVTCSITIPWNINSYMATELNDIGNYIVSVDGKEAC